MHDSTNQPVHDSSDSVQATAASADVALDTCSDNSKGELAITGVPAESQDTASSNSESPPLDSEESLEVDWANSFRNLA